MRLLYSILVSLAIAARPRTDGDAFPGWLGERKPNEKGSPSSISTYKGPDGNVIWSGEVIHMGWKPRAYLFKGFLSQEEADKLKAHGEGRLTKSQVVDSKTGHSKSSEVRTSSGTFLSRGMDDFIDAVEDRIATVSMIPKDHGEGLQILKYVDGQKYDPHFDYFNDVKNKDGSHGGQRIATMLIYLSTPEEGGETVFPNADKKVSGPGWSDCARRGFALHPQKGDAILFFSLKPDGSEDTSSLHGSCPVTKGEKWSATKWMHVSTFGLSAAAQKAKWGDCIDVEASCAAWAADGECEKNSAYMHENCKLSCKICTPGAPAKKTA